jgi:hypothetical protein
MPEKIRKPTAPDAKASRAQRSRYKHRFMAWVRNYVEWRPCEFIRALAKLREHQYPEVKELAGLHQHVAQFKVPKEKHSATRYLKQHDRAIWNGVDPLIQYFAGKLIVELKTYDLPFYVHTAWRSPELQQQLYAKGLSQARSGPHTRGAAVDIVHSDFHWNGADDRLWEFVGLLGKDIIKRHGLAIEWGGDWNFYDPAHWQLMDWRLCEPYDTDSFFAYEYDPDTREYDAIHGEIITKTPQLLHKENVSYGRETRKRTVERLKR